MVTRRQSDKVTHHVWVEPSWEEMNGGHWHGFGKNLSNIISTRVVFFLASFHCTCPLEFNNKDFMVILNLTGLDSGKRAILSEDRRLLYFLFFKFLLG